MKKFMTGLCMVTVGVMLLASSAIAAEPTKDSLETVKKNMKKEEALLVDVREKREWKAGHVEDAVFLPLSKLRDGMSIKELTKILPKDQIIYTHCAVGVRSCTAADILKRYDYDVRPLKPGYKDLLNAGFEKAKK